MVGLAQHRAETAHLPKQPLQDFAAGALLGRQKTAALLRQVVQDRTGFEDRDRLAIRPLFIDDRGDLVVRADRQERRVELLALAEIDPMGAVGQADLLQHDVDLLTVGRGRRVEIDHRRLRLLRGLSRFS